MTLVASCTTERGSKITLRKTVHVVEAGITEIEPSVAETAASNTSAIETKQLSVNLVECGTELTDLSLQWFWMIDELIDGAEATIDAMTGLLSFFSPGSVAVRAICTTNSDLIARATYTM